VHVHLLLTRRHSVSAHSRAAVQQSWRRSGVAGDRLVIDRELSLAEPIRADGCSRRGPDPIDLAGPHHTDLGCRTDELHSVARRHPAACGDGADLGPLLRRCARRARARDVGRSFEQALTLARHDGMRGIQVVCTDGKRTIDAPPLTAGYGSSQRCMRARPHRIRTPTPHQKRVTGSHSRPDPPPCPYHCQWFWPVRESEWVSHCSAPHDRRLALTRRLLDSNRFVPFGFASDGVGALAFAAAARGRPPLMWRCLRIYYCCSAMVERCSESLTAGGGSFSRRRRRLEARRRECRSPLVRSG
jgi:hypothetical protein